jgi:CDP-diacylglycerol--glycerol-3-phosphate 3-phosphatidyltransferase
MRSINLAIALTLSRTFVAPVFAYAFIHSAHSPSPAMWLWISVILMTYIELSDTFDGRLARARNQVTDFGKLIDPLADSISRQTIFLSFLIAGIIPFWLFLIFLYRDSVMSTLRTMIALGGTVQAAKKSGKIKAVFQGIGAFGVLGVCLLLAYDVPGVPEHVAGYHLGFWIMLVPAIITVVSVADYLVPNWAFVKQMMKPKSR